MSIAEPLPVSGYGKADWVDYSNYWREGDAEWLMERTVLRYADAASRQTQFPTPKFGQITYNEQAINLGGGTYADRPEMWSKQHGAWVPLLMLANLTSTRDDSGGVAMSHKLAGGKGVQFQPTQTVLDNPILVMGGVLYVDADSVDIKTGARTVKLTTDATSLVVDSPLSATALATAGALTAVSAALSGSLTVPNITMSGTLSGGGILNGASGTIGGILLSGNNITAPSGTGMQSGQGHFYGDASSAMMRQRASVGAAEGGPYVQVTSDRTNIGGTAAQFLDVYPTMRYFGGKGIQWINAGGTHQAWISPTIVNASDPGAANFPDGTIWIVP